MDRFSSALYHGLTWHPMGKRTDSAISKEGNMVDVKRTFSIEEFSSSISSWDKVIAWTGLWMLLGGSCDDGVWFGWIGVC